MLLQYLWKSTFFTFCCFKQENWKIVLASISDENRKDFPTGIYSKSEIADGVLIGTLGLFSTGQVKPLQTEETVSGFVSAKGWGQPILLPPYCDCWDDTATGISHQPRWTERLMLMWRKWDEVERWRWVVWKQAPNCIFFQIIILALFIWICLLPAMRHMGFHTNTAGLLHTLIVEQCS